MSSASRFRLLLRDGVPYTMQPVKRLVQVMSLHRMGFMTTFNIQQRYAQQHLDEMKHPTHSADEEGHILNTILLVEHDPVYTTGMRNKFSSEEEERLKKTGAGFYRTNRGGLITFHGPGQLVAYPILNLKQFGLGMKEYIANLEQTMISACKGFGLEATTTEHTGVWIGDRKIGAIGVHGSRYVTTHGISLNCNTDLAWYKHIVPCGIEGKDVTSLSKELNQDVSITQCVPVFLEAFADHFNCEFIHPMMESEDYNLLPNKENFDKIEKDLHKTIPHHT